MAKQKVRLLQAGTADRLETLLEAFLNRDSVTDYSVAFDIQVGGGYQRVFFALITYTYNDGVK